MSSQAKGISHSVHVRLVAHANAIGVEANSILNRFALERLLYRLSCSPHRDRFVLKGALLMLFWLGERTRPTRDGDLLGFGDLSDAALVRLFAEISTMAVEADGMEFDATSIRVVAIRQEDVYGGSRVTLEGRLGNARLPVQIDVGVGDAVSPEPSWIDYPSLLDLPKPRLRAYHPETAIAEKVHAMVVLGSKNSRMRDFFDIHALASHRPFIGDRLADALRETFARRGTALPDGLPTGLTPEFASSRDKRAQWAAFRRRSNLASMDADLGELIEELAAFVGPAIEAARRNEGFRQDWQPGGPWQRGE